MSDDARRDLAVLARATFGDYWRQDVASRMAVDVSSLSRWFSRGELRPDRANHVELVCTAELSRIRERGEPIECLAGRRVLVVEDDYLQAMDVARMVEEIGAEPIGPAHSLEQACRLADEQQLDAAVLDVRLGEKTVRPAAVKLHNRAVPIIYVTGNASTLERILGADISAYPTIEKPQRLETVTAALVTAMCRDGDDPLAEPPDKPAQGNCPAAG